ncbi:alpha/beta hydrolase [Kineococcus endophyticus]|uniref:Alpha/beta hydrolase n=1 Tax=Kineococcus endophyticus TaxID=1181883 RepID=A0ABV3P5A2_9ACTN
MTSCTVEPFRTTVRGLELRGTRYRPAGDGPAPTAVLFHGFGGSRVETTGVFVTLARRLVAAGTGVVAFDRAGHGESDGEFFDTTVTQDVEDSRRVLDVVAALPGVDAQDLHLVGMSLGSVVASVVAADRPAGIRSLTMWSTAAVFADEVRGGTLQGRPLDVLDGQGFFDFLGQRLGPALREDARGWDPWARAAGWRGPTLLLHGTDDFVPLGCARRYLDDDVLGDRAELVVVEGADHGWAQLPQRDTVVAATVAFTTRHARRA